MDAFTTHTGVGVPLRAQQRRHRPDHPRGLPQAGHPHRLRGRPVRGLAQRPRLRAQQPDVRRGSVLVAGPDFGTGSSREHAVWALQNYGFKVVISSPLRRHLPRQLRQGRAARRAGRREGRAAAVGLARGQPGRRDHRRPGEPHRPRRCRRGRRRGLLRHRRLHARGGCSKGLDDIGITLGARRRHHRLRGGPTELEARHCLKKPPQIGAMVIVVTLPCA